MCNEKLMVYIAEDSDGFMLAISRDKDALLEKVKNNEDIRKIYKFERIEFNEDKSQILGYRWGHAWTIAFIEEYEV